MTYSVAMKADQLIRNVADIKGLALRIQTEGRKVDAMIQVALCSATVHAYAHGDVTLLNDLVGKLSTGIRTNSAKAFVEAFAPVRWNQQKKEFRMKKERMVENFEATEAFTKMLATEWLSFRPEPEYKGVDSVKVLTSALNKIESAIEDSKDASKDAVSAEDLADIQALIQRIEARRAAQALEAAKAGLVEAEPVEAAQA